MSSSSSVHDVALVAELTQKLHHFCSAVSRGAPHEFQLLLQQIASLSQTVQLLQHEATAPDSAVMKSGPDRIQMVGEVMCRVKETLMEVQRFTDKYEDLDGAGGTKRNVIWNKLKLSSDVETLGLLGNKVRPWAWNVARV